MVQGYYGVDRASAPLSVILVIQLRALALCMAFSCLYDFKHVDVVIDFHFNCTFF